MADSLTNLIQSGREITASQLRSPKQGLAASVSRTRSRQSGSPAASPFAPEQFTAPSFAGNLPATILSSLYAGQGVPQEATGTMLGRFLEEMFRRGKGDDAAVMRAFEVVSRIEGSIADLNDQIAALSRELNKMAPVAEAERAPERPAGSRIPRTSPIKAPRAPSAASPPQPPREPPQTATGGDGGEERPSRGSRRFEHDLMRAGKAILAGAEISAEAIAEQLSVSAGRAAKLLAELTHREVISPVERGKRQPLVYGEKELAGRLGVRGAIPGVIQSEETGNAKRFTRMLRGVKVSAPPRRPPTVDEGTGDEPREYGLQSDPTKPPPQRGSLAERALRWALRRPRRDEQEYGLQSDPTKAPPEAGSRAERSLQRMLRWASHRERPAPKIVTPKVVRSDAEQMYDAELALRTPTAEKVRGLSLAERYRRLKKSGMLATREAISRRYGVDEPSQEFRVREGEAFEERRRQRRLAQRQGKFGDVGTAAQYGLQLAGSKLAAAGSRLAGMFGMSGTQQRLAGVAAAKAPGTMRQFAAAQAARAGVAGIGAAAGGMAGGALGALFSPGGQLAMAAVALPASLWGAVRAGEAFATSTLEASRGLEKWSGGIARAFGNLRRQDLLLERSMARSTTGSTVALAKSVESMREEMQSVKESMRTMTNLVATGTAKLVEFVAWAAKKDPSIAQAQYVLKLAERWLSKSDGKDAPLFFDQVREITQGQLRPKAERPEI